MSKDLIITNIDRENKEITVTSDSKCSGDSLYYTTSNSTVWSGPITWSVIDERLPLYMKDDVTQYLDPQDYYRITQLALEIFKKEQEYKADFETLVNK